MRLPRIPKPNSVLSLVAGLMFFLAAGVVSVPGATQAAEPIPPQAQEGLYLRGQLLVASPDIMDPRFMRSVVYMVKHSETGAVGLIINKVYGAGPLREFLKGLNIDPGNVEGTINLHYGGPVSPGAGFVLHTPDYNGPNTRAVNKDMALSTELDIMRAIAEGRGQRNSLIAMGYSGWASGQLEGEIERGDWLSAPAGEALIFDDDQKTKRDRASGKAGLNL
jgi:putative transcriptional regulator